MTYSLLLFFLLCLTFLASETSAVSYTYHCASIIPELSQTAPFRERLPLIDFATGYFSGGENILGKTLSSNASFLYSKRTLLFRTTRNVYTTEREGVYKLEAYLDLLIPLRNRKSKRSRFLLSGFWNESSGRLCAVGKSSSSSSGGKGGLETRLTLNYVGSNATFNTSVVNGTLESLSSSFDTVSFYAFPPLSSYNYTLVTEDFDKDLPQGVKDQASQSLGLPEGDVCPMLSRFRNLELEYPKGCGTSQACNPFRGVLTTSLPGFMSMYAIQCSPVKEKLRNMIEIPGRVHPYGYSYPPESLHTTWIGEGSWDRKRKQVKIVAYRVLSSGGISNSSFMLTLRFPATWTIQSSSTVMGNLWSKGSSPSGVTTIMNAENDQPLLPGLNYEYSELERAKKLLPLHKTEKGKKKKGEKYPIPQSRDMRLDMNVKTSSAEFGWVSAMPISVGSELFEAYRKYRFTGILASEDDEESTTNEGLVDISYKLSLTPFSDIKLSDKLYAYNLSSGSKRTMEITAEGAYNTETGQLCMVGCRRLSSSARNLTGKSTDCEIRVDFEFPPLRQRERRRNVNGSIRSTRKESDPLYFTALNLTSSTFYEWERKEFIWRMDVEIVMVLVSSTLACIFVAAQLFRVKKHPEMLPSISLLMLLILTLGYLIPLVINFEALFLNNNKRDDMYYTRGGWLEMNEVIVRSIILVAFLLMSRLLLLAWTARSAPDHAHAWAAERKVLLLSSPVYIIGAVIATLVHWSKTRPYNVQNPILGDLRSYAVLIVDAFLLPQILLNLFLGSADRVLSPVFYAGTTLLRLLPHAYDLYRVHEYARNYPPGSYAYAYANPSTDLFCRAWDVIISLGGVALAVIIYLQQRVGSRFLLPKRFRGFFELYEKVSVTQ